MYQLFFKEKGYSLLFTLCSVIISMTAKAQSIDRFDLVNRHNVILNEIDPLSPLSIGNGDFAYTADITGMQSLEKYYYTNGIPLETLSTFAWHSFPNTKNLKLEDAMKASDFHGRKIMYASQEKSAAGEYFRQNPHPAPLGQISLVRGNGKSLEVSDINHVNQKLNLWKGLLSSSYEIDGKSVTVETVSSPDQNIVAFSLKSSLLKEGKLKPAFRFPYAYDLSIKNKPPFEWNKPSLHTTTIISKGSNNVLLKRIIDSTEYYVTIYWQGKAKFESDEPHHFYLNATGSENLQIVCRFSLKPIKQYPPQFSEVRTASELSWKDYWTKGGAVDFSGSKDPRAGELERRVILSQYLMKINYAGSFPPQETGLTHISWYGKHNSEVYWWHAAQFYQWNHTDLLEKSFSWYKTILPIALKEAKREGFEGARWPKMAGIDGRTSPGGINPFIIWNQPNPIYLAELIYRKSPNDATLQKYSDVVFESANFLASYAFYDAKTDRFILGPPLKSVNEKTNENTTQNPTFELVQWYYGLKVAQDWRVRMGMPRNVRWDEILKKLSYPTIKDDKYLEMETDPDMYDQRGGFSSAMLMSLGYLPQTPLIDLSVMHNTFNTIYERNGLRSFVSWSLGKGAMTAARLGEQEKAIDILCNALPGAVFLKNGHVQRAKEPLACPAYLPANSAFLSAVALMAAGWDNGPEKNAPGFPQNGNWNIKVENLNKLP
ncbi:hypothetical protein NZ698_01310 [Chryseobacterium sp. PBS4-4]|uniref:Glycoside hydrolase family 65 n=1 Tax=Chryseobacterium edaphi TaxID=2976532 RepID=A0ABT2W0P8_9FLAO|nr:hypothetical protein [Chryseobacterium edaphi]MCU7615822.1 hypothetical protein [Chryseobacterium edaphi]